MNHKTGRQEPTLSFSLPYKVTDGSIAAELYAMTGREPMEWQENLIYDILARNDDGLYTHTRYGYSVPRRNGKGEIIIMRELYGLAIGEKMLHTAHLTSTAHNAWERTCGILNLLKVEYSSIKAKGQEYIRMDGGGEIHFRTRTATGALGEGFDLVVIDEAQEYRIEHQTALKYVVTSSKNPQTLLCGTPPTAVSAGTVFRDFREDVLSGGAENAGWAEWSVDSLKPPLEREWWYMCNPSLGLTLTERGIADEAGSTEAEKIDFNIQRLGLWLKYSQQSAISEKAWDSLKLDTLPGFAGKLYIGIKYSKDGLSVSVSLAIRASDGRVFIEAVGRCMVRDGNAWIVSFLKSVKDSAAKVIVDGANGEELLKKDMSRAKLKAPVFLKVREVIEANQGFENDVYLGRICHMGQPSLRRSVSNAEHRAIGSSGGFGYRSIKDNVDVSLLEAAALAHFGASNYKEVVQKVLM